MQQKNLNYRLRDKTKTKSFNNIKFILRPRTPTDCWGSAWPEEKGAKGIVEQGESNFLRTWVVGWLVRKEKLRYRSKPHYIVSSMIAFTMSLSFDFKA